MEKKKRSVTISHNTIAVLTYSLVVVNDDSRIWRNLQTQLLEQVLHMRHTCCYGYCFKYAIEMSNFIWLSAGTYRLNVVLNVRVITRNVNTYSLQINQSSNRVNKLFSYWAELFLDAYGAWCLYRPKFKIIHT